MPTPPEVPERGPLIESPRLVPLTRWLVAATSLLLVALVFVSALRRLRYPFSLDWMEENNLIEVTRLVHHLPIYAAPNVHYTSFIYAPLFVWLAAQMSHIVGVGYPSMRLVSILSLAALFAGIFAFVHAEAPRRSPARVLSALVAVGLFATAYPITQGFLDVGRVDTLCLMLAMFGLLLTRRGHLIGAALVFAGAVQAKQGILPIAVLALCCDWQRPRRLLLGLGSLLFFCTASIAWLNHGSGGWYWTYVFRVAPGFQVNYRIVEFFLPREIVPVAGISLLVIVAGAVLTLPRRLDRNISFYLLTGLGMVVYTAYVRAHAGAAGNADLPAFLWIAFTAGVCFERLYRRLGEKEMPLRSGALLVLLAAPFAQMFVHLYGPAYWVPTAIERADRETLIAQIRSLPGDVLVVNHPQYALAAGKVAYVDGNAMDALITSKLPLGPALKADFGLLLRQHQFTAVLLEGPLFVQAADDRLPSDFARLYPVHAYLAPPHADLDVTNRHLLQPVWAFLPCPSPSVPDPRLLLPGIPIDMSGCSLPSTGQTK